MECKLVYDNISVREKLYEENIEKPLDIDFTLPDSCPDAERILKCFAEPRIKSKSVFGKRAEADGEVLLKIYYLSDDNDGIHICDKALPFSVSAELSKEGESPLISVSAKPQYLNCRAVSRRRIDVHGAVSIKLTVFDKGCVEFVSEVEEEEIEVKRAEAALSELAFMREERFEAESVFELPLGRGPIENILRIQSSCLVNEAKCISGGIKLQGVLYVSVLYDSGSDSLQKAEYEIPFSENFNESQAEPEFILNEKTVICDEEAEIKEDGDGENTMISYKAEIITELAAFKEKTAALVCDAYSKCFESRTDIKKQRLMHAVNSFEDVFSVSTVLSEPGIYEIIDVFPENLSAALSVKDGILSAKGKYSLCVFYKTDGGETGFFDRPADFEFTKELRGNPPELSCMGNCSLRFSDYKFTADGSLEIKTDIVYNVLLYTENEVRFLSAVYEDETAAKDVSKKDPLCIYFAQRGEELWDIAREHLTSVNQIKSENPSLEDKLSKDRTIIIPM